MAERSAELIAKNYADFFTRAELIATEYCAENNAEFIKPIKIISRNCSGIVTPILLRRKKTCSLLRGFAVANKAYKQCGSLCLIKS